MCDRIVLAIERYMVPWIVGYDAVSKINPEIAAEAKQYSEGGISTGFAHTLNTGWVVLVTGQGPFILWQERGEIVNGDGDNKHRVDDERTNDYDNWGNHSRG